ncbi:MAG: DUF177 domain-containing protein [Defluviitaleaceae bacterium]|nr:DUF177 domain-containing protein [Defluviitaleaceae bacterium]MCL2836587.1 DUF177 domain-containing protein [Defluviitaleaceae bacterium]
MELTVDVSQTVPGETVSVNVKGPVRLPDGFSHGKKAAAADVSFTGSLCRESGVFQTGRFIIEGSLTAEIPAVCALCLKDIRWTVDCGIREFYSREPGDIDEWPAADNILDLTQAFAANILTALPMKLVCSEGCKGLCPACGKDRNNDNCSCNE